jgi:hypothetical protein
MKGKLKCPRASSDVNSDEGRSDEFCSVVLAYV